MNRKEIEQRLGAHVLDNTRKVLEALPDDDEMVFGTRVFSKTGLLKEFDKYEELTVLIAENLDKTVKDFLVRTNYGKKPRRKQPRKST